MPRHDLKSPRLFVDAPLGAGASVALDRSQTNYLGNVLRLGAGDTVRIFNGRDGEWRAQIVAGRRTDILVAQEQTRPQPDAFDLRYVFAPLKQARLDYMVQKAVEMGASALAPVLTRHTQVARLNEERMRANAIEAAEQCGILTLPRIAAPLALPAFLAARDAQRLLVFCDEAAADEDPLAVLRAHAAQAARGIDVLVGPEGGFAMEERAELARQPCVATISLGPRILRADTAAVAALALVGATLSDPPGRAAPPAQSH
jgi:16S rRNA (uracil1498-N3)-methyltransferase